MLRRRLRPSCLCLAACALFGLAATAHASYGQMRRDGIGLLLAFLLLVTYGLVVDVALIARLFGRRAAMVGGVVIVVGVIGLLVGLGASPGERTGYFKGAPGGSSLVVLVLTCAVFAPFIVVAPIAQHHSLRQGRRWPRAITVAMGLQVALLPAFIGLAVADEHFWRREYARGQAIGARIRAGDLETIVAQVGDRHERIWGTPWFYLWPQRTPSGSSPRSSGWIAGLVDSLESSR
ncbi:MAG: hypothetical protein K0Q76_3847 [Panacagrimonas sp.]|nr:hypothetical protein [Panacagrimonas sp.]MCC2658739.1 hypothetical protein [Panacagrimonas sp.]